MSDRYEAEVELATTKAERREQVAVERLAAAEARLAKARLIRQVNKRQHAVLVAQELVELRRQELLVIQRLMQSVPASSQHRSRKAHRPVPAQKTL